MYQAFGLTILEGGFFHADPHPGNIFVLDDGRVGLIDFGQVKQIGARASTTLAKVMVALAARGAGGGEGEDEAQLDGISRLALELGVRLRDGSPREGPVPPHCAYPPPTPTVPEPRLSTRGASGDGDLAL